MLLHVVIELVTSCFASNLSWAIKLNYLLAGLLAGLVSPCRVALVRHDLMGGSAVC
jgi:hypothetical protein